MLLYSALYSVSLLKVSISSNEVLNAELHVATYIWFKEVENEETYITHSQIIVIKQTHISATSDQTYM